MLFEMELERVAQNKLTAIQELIFTKKIPEALIFGDEKQIEPFESKIITVHLNKETSRQYIENVFIGWERQKLANDRKITALVNIKTTYAELKQPKKKRVVAETQVLAQKRI